MTALFERELQKGTGLPLLLLKKGILVANDQLNEIITNAIIDDYYYNAQNEGLRGDYLYEIVSIYSKKDEIFKKLVKIFEEMQGNESSEEQIASFVSNMVKNNLYSLDKYYMKVDWYIIKYRAETSIIPGLGEIIKLDGINAVKHYTKLIGKNLPNDNYLSEIFFENIIGYSPEEIKLILKKEEDNDINNYLEFIEMKPYWLSNMGENKRASFEEIRQRYEKNRRRSPSLGGWLTHATDDEIQKVSDWYLTTKDTKLKSGILKNFSKIKIRIDEDYLWKELKRTRNLYYKSAIIEALIPFDNIAVKYFINSFFMINSYYNKEETKIAVLKAFIRFVDNEDEYLLEGFLDGLDSGGVYEILHFILESTRIKELVFYPKVLHKLYEKNKCSCCRLKIVNEMLKFNCIDENLLAEIEYDCNWEIRKIANKLKSKKHFT